MRLRPKNIHQAGALDDMLVRWNGSIWEVAGYHQRAESLGRSTSASGSFAEKLSLTTASNMPAGDYLVVWHWSWDLSSNTGSIRTRIQLDNVDIEDYQFEPQDVSTNQTNVVSGFRERTMTAGEHDIDVDYSSQLLFRTAGIKDCWVEIFQIKV
jgi:hypothetical protein